MSPPIMDIVNLERLRAKYGSDQEHGTYDPRFRKVVDRLFQGGTRQLPYAGLPTLLPAPAMQGSDFTGLQVALAGIPMDLGVSNRSGARFGPRALRTVERIGPYNGVLDCMPLADLKVAPVYVTFDIDYLDPSFAPGTGTPEIGGLTTREVLRILQGLKGINVIGGDVVEIAPQYDTSTNTAQTGSTGAVRDPEPHGVQCLHRQARGLRTGP